LIEPEMERLTVELRGIVAQKGIRTGEYEVEDVLTYALFQQVGLKFLENRDNPAAFEPAPTAEQAAPKATAPATGGGEVFTVTGRGQSFRVQVSAVGSPSAAAAAASAALVNVAGKTPSSAAAPAQVAAGPVIPKDAISAPLAGNVWKIVVAQGQRVQEGDLLLVLEAMKMENEIIADRDGIIGELLVAEGSTVEIGQILLTLV
jgi:oxaloacetate decarboxylase alpha subunit